MIMGNIVQIVRHVRLMVNVIVLVMGYAVCVMETDVVNCVSKRVVVIG